MKKDYLPVAPASLDLDEAAFVEQYWTEQWRDRRPPIDASAIAHREEYRIMRPFLDRLPPGSRVLDGGCGTGEWTVFLSEQGFKVVGVDISEQTISRLVEWFPHLEFARADLRATSFEPESFDAYFSWGTFEHFESGLAPCLIEAHRILRQGGLLFVSVPFDNGRLLVRDAFALLPWRPSGRCGDEPPRHERFYQWRLTEPELRRELEIHRFKVHVTAPIGKLTGAGRLLRSDLRLFARRSRLYNAACRMVALVTPARFIGHMIVAVAERR